MNVPTESQWSVLLSYSVEENLTVISRHTDWASQVLCRIAAEGHNFHSTFTMTDITSDDSVNTIRERVLEKDVRYKRNAESVIEFLNIIRSASSKHRIIYHCDIKFELSNELDAGKVDMTYTCTFERTQEMSNVKDKPGIDHSLWFCHSTGEKEKRGFKNAIEALDKICSIFSYTEYTSGDIHSEEINELLERKCSAPE